MDSFLIGSLDDLILRATSDDFEVGNVHVIIMDDQGNAIERDAAFEEPVGPDFWIILLPSL